MDGRRENVSQGRKCGAAEGTGPIAEGVKEPDKMEGGLLSVNDCKEEIKTGRVVRNTARREEVNGNILGGWTRRERRRTGVYASGGMARRFGGGGGGR